MCEMTIKRNMKSLLIVPLWMLSVVLLGQGEFKFEREVYDFGNIKEGEQAKYTFKFKNVGNEPILISGVKASCGCTTPSWTKTPVLPGQEGEVTASYNSKNRPGSFHKSITITSNAATPSKVLRIKGYTEKDNTGLYTEEQLANSPKVHVIDPEFNFGKVVKGQTLTRKFTIKNVGKGELNVTNARSNCNCVSFRIDNQAIGEGETATMTLNYHPRRLGEQMEFVTIQSNDIASPRPFRVRLKADVQEQFDSKPIIKNSEDQITF